MLREVGKRNQSVLSVFSGSIMPSCHAPCYAMPSNGLPRQANWLLDRQNQAMLCCLSGSAPLFGHCAGDLFEIGDTPFSSIADQ